MAVPSDGSYGIPNGLMFSFPVTITDGEWKIVQGLTLDDTARQKIADTQKVKLNKEVSRFKIIFKMELNVIYNWQTLPVHFVTIIQILKTVLLTFVPHYYAA